MEGKRHDHKWLHSGTVYSLTSSPHHNLVGRKQTENRTWSPSIKPQRTPHPTIFQITSSTGDQVSKPIRYVSRSDHSNIPPPTLWTPFMFSGLSPSVKMTKVNLNGLFVFFVIYFTGSSIPPELKISY